MDQLIEIAIGLGVIASALLMAYFKGDKDRKSKVEKEVLKENGKSAKKAKQRLQHISTSSDNEFLDLVRKSER